MRSERTGGARDRKVNIARDEIRQNYCRIKIYRMPKVRLGKLTSHPAHVVRLWLFDILYASQKARSRDCERVIYGGY